MNIKGYMPWFKNKSENKKMNFEDTTKYPSGASFDVSKL